jgi:alpha-mannosidase
MSDRRTFLGWLGAGAAALDRLRHRRAIARGPADPIIDARPSALYQQPDGRKNLVRITVSGLAAPAARARVTDRHGALVGTAGMLASSDGTTLAGEVWVPLSEAAEFQIELEVAKRSVGRRRVRLVPPRRWTLYWLSTNHTDVGYTDLQERALEVHRKNLDAALARLPAHPDYRWSAECALQVLSYLENRPAADGDALLQAIRDGKIGFHALFANLLTGILDHETAARMIWPAGLLARERGLSYVAAQITDVPGQCLTFPMILAGSGVRYLASGPNPERALPLLPRSEAAPLGLAGDWTAYPQLYWWEGPDGSRVLHWRSYHYGDALRFGFERGPDEMGRRLSDWLLGNPALQSPAWPYDLALLYGAQWDNALMDEGLIANMEEFRRRFAFPRIVPGRAEDFFRELERRYPTQIPARRGDTGLYWEDGAASTAAALARFRAAQLTARAAEIAALWDTRVEPADDARADRIRARSEERRQVWRDLLLFGEHTWGAAESVSAPDSRQTVEQWAYKRRYLEGAEAAARGQLEDALERIGRATNAGPGRIAFNAANWPRTDVVRVSGAAGQALAYGGQAFPAVDLENGDALVLLRDVPPLGYLALTTGTRAPVLPADDGDALEAAAGGFRVRLDPGTGAIASLAGPDGTERVRTSPWSGLNQLLHVAGGERSALWTAGDRSTLAAAPALDVAGAARVASRRLRLPGIGVQLVCARTLRGASAVTSRVTLYDALPWVDIENRIAKTATLDKEAVYAAFPFAFTHPSVELEVPLGRMTVEHDQQPGSGRDWYCHTHWVWLHEGTDGVLWSAPDAPLVTLNDLFRGAWRRTIIPDGTLFSYAANNYWHTNYAARQGGDLVLRYRISLLAPGDAAEAVRRGWDACDPLVVSPPYTNAAPGPLIARDSALSIPDRGVLVVGAKPADDGDGAIVRLLDVRGADHTVGVWPAAFTFQQARRVNLVEMNGAALPVSADRSAAVDVKAWGVAAARLFTPRETAG